jgi:multiple sugar transport system ATP-binding protein
MGAVVLRKVAKRFGAVEVLRDIDLEIAEGALAVVVGPSGCGKSTVLRLVAGLEEASAGSIEIAGRDVTHLPPSARRIAMVFQSYALYPHMSVYDNMAFGLKLARQDKAKIRERIEDAARLLQIEHLLARKPRELSGGQRQRVAMGRALVREPAVFLFDEPLSNLDAALRVGMRLEIARLQRQLGATMLYVTHDQTEAMTLAQVIVVMRDGRIEQVGAPLDLYRRPCNLFVASFLGTPSMNVLAARAHEASGSELAAEVEGAPRLTLPPRPGVRPGDGLSLGLRPEDLRLGDPAGRLAGEAAMPAVVSHVEHLGGESHVYLDVGGQRLTVSMRGVARVATGEAVSVLFSPARCHLFAAGGEALPAATDGAPARPAGF